METNKAPENYYPPKDLANAVWGYCFDYKDIDTIIHGETIRDRINDLCYFLQQHKHLL